MTKTLLSHQISDAKFLAGRKVAGNFSGMGSGKTLSALEAVRLTGKRALVVVCPPIAMNMWRGEIESHLGRNAQIIKTGKEALFSPDHAYVVSFAIATKRKDELRALLGHGFSHGGVLIFDECHALKSVAAKRTVAMIGKGGLIESADHTWFLSGTPVTRWNDDIFPFLVRANNGVLRDAIGGMSMERFQLRFCVTQMKKFHARQRFPTKVVVGNRNTDELNRMLFDTPALAVRHELADVWAEMPPITKTRLAISPVVTPELRELLKAMDKKNISQIQQDLRNKDESTAKARRLLGEAKVKAAVAEIVERVEAGSSGILVLAWHRNVIDSLFAALPDFGRAAVIDGRTSPAGKQAAQNAFNDGHLDVLIGQIAAMGVAIDLQHGGHNILVVEEDWSPAVMDQAFARLHRMGQASHVHVDILTTDTTLDQAIGRIAATKAREHGKLMEQA